MDPFNVIAFFEACKVAAILRHLYLVRVKLQLNSDIRTLVIRLQEKRKIIMHV